MMKKVLITGGFGYVGSRLTPHLLEEGYSVSVIDLMLYGDSGLVALKNDPKFPEWEKRFSFFQEDIRDPKAVAEAMEGVDGVIHLAGISNDPTGEIDEVLTRQVNYDAIGILLATAKKAGVSRFINASSSSVFGIKSEAQISEGLEPEPITYYSKYKMLSEWLVVAASAPDMCTVNIRPATVCGVSARQRFDLTVNKLTADGVQKGVITVHGGQQRRPNVGMTDMVEIYSVLLKKDPAQINGRTFNFGFENHKVIEIAEIIRDELKDLNVEIKVTDAFDQRDYHISSEKILNELDYKPVSSIRQEVRSLRKALELGSYPDVEADTYYNMRSMQLERNAAPYELLSC
tara:strand:+ start:76834 stop:77871 length:1038 start_codon:yes stop_codon:yes gene_type:complete